MYKRLNLATFRWWAKGSGKTESKGPTALHIRFCSLSKNPQVVVRSSSPLKITVFHGKVYSRCLDMQSNPRRKKLYRTNQGPNFLWDSFSNRSNVRAPIQFRIKTQPQYLKRLFFSRADSPIFTLIAPVLLDVSKKTGWVFRSLK